MQTASFYHMLSVIYLLIIARTEILVQIIFELNTIITPPILLGRRTAAPHHQFTFQFHPGHSFMSVIDPVQQQPQGKFTHIFLRLNSFSTPTAVISFAQ